MEMSTAEDVIRRATVDATSAAHGEKAAALSADDLVIQASGRGNPREARTAHASSAAKHGEIDGRKQSVSLTALEGPRPRPLRRDTSK